jgi:ACS family tartrate transporter-like MFS transporter
MVGTLAFAPNQIELSAVRKLRTRIIPFVFVLMVIASLDRINIGFAALTMNKQLAISSQQYGFLAGIFFLGYFFFEIPSNLLLHKIGARIWIARILISWGIVAMLTGLVQTAEHLYIARFLLGVAEAGYFPGILLYLTYWFPQRQLAGSLALFLTASPAASIIGAPLSGVILDHVHWFGASSWRWLLILEGIPAIVGGVLTYFLLPGRPAEASFLTTSEKDWITAELAHEEQQKLVNRRITAWQALAHGRVWHLTFIYFAAMGGYYVMTFWMPQFLKALGTHYSNTRVGLMVMIPHVIGLICMILVAHNSDRILERRYHAAIAAIVASGSFVLLGTTSTSPFFSVVLWCLVASGIYSLIPPFWALPNEFLTGFSAAAGIALINSVGNLGGFVGPYAMGAMSKNTGLVLAGTSFLISALLILILRQPTKQQAAGCTSSGQPTATVLPTA